MPYINDSKALQDTRRSIFGLAEADERMPSAFLDALHRMTATASSVLGVKHHHTARQALWLDGHTLGVLSCTGNSDADANIDGRIIRLDSLETLVVDVKVEPDKWENSSKYGRVLTITEEIKIDASPNSADSDVREAREFFIDAVLAAVAGRKSQQ